MKKVILHMKVANLYKNGEKWGFVRFFTGLEFLQNFS
jgi:hypothetical protein